MSSLEYIHFRCYSFLDKSLGGGGEDTSLCLTSDLNKSGVGELKIQCITRTVVGA